MWPIALCFWLCCNISDWHDGLCSFRCSGVLTCWLAQLKRNGWAPAIGAPSILLVPICAPFSAPFSYLGWPPWAPFEKSFPPFFLRWHCNVLFFFHSVIFLHSNLVYNLALLWIWTLLETWIRVTQLNRIFVLEILLLHVGCAKEVHREQLIKRPCWPYHMTPKSRNTQYPPELCWI